MKEIENHHLANAAVLIVRKRHWQMLKLVGESMFKKQDICVVSNYLPTRCLVITNE